MTWCLCYTVVKSDSGYRPGGNQSAISWGVIGNRLTIGRRLVGDCILGFFLVSESLFGDRSATDRRLVGDQSATKTVSGLSATAAMGRQSVANQLATSWQPVGDHQNPFHDRFGRREVSLAATKISWRPNRPCNLLQPVGDQSQNFLQPPCYLPAPTEILVARGSPTSCKPCVTGT